MTKPAVILFDFGQTLADYLPIHDEYVRILERHGYSGCTPASILAAAREFWSKVDGGEGYAHGAESTDRQAYFDWTRDVEREVLRSAGVTNITDAALTEIAGFLNVIPDRYVLYDDTLPALADLKAAGFRLGIISNFHWDLEAVVERLGVAGYFEHVVTSARAGFRKPHPEVFRAALSLFGTEPDDAVMVGDSMSSDVAGARNAGIRGILIDRAGVYPKDAGALKDLSQLAQALSAI